MRKNYPSTNKNNLIKLENICRSRNVPQAVNTLNEQHAHYPAFVLRVTNVNVCMHTYILVHMALTHINCLSHIGREASAADTKSGMKKTHLNVGVRVCATRVTILCTRILIPESGIQVLQGHSQIFEKQQVAPVLLFKKCMFSRERLNK